MKQLLFISFTLLSLSVIAQKTVHDPMAQRRDVTNFHAISVGNGIQLLLSQGPHEAVAVSAADEEARQNIKTEVRNGVLKIYYDGDDTWKFWKRRGNLKLKAYVSFSRLDRLDVSSGAHAKVDGTVKVNAFTLEASSGAVFDGRVETTSLRVEQSSGSSVSVSGTAGSLTIDGSSGSMFKGYDLVVDQCDADMSSGSGMQITVNKQLKAEASSGGSVSYRGTGAVTKHTSSGGSVSKKG